MTQYYSNLAIKIGAICWKMEIILNGEREEKRRERERRILFKMLPGKNFWNAAHIFGLSIGYDILIFVFSFMGQSILLGSNKTGHKDPLAS